MSFYPDVMPAAQQQMLIQLGPIAGEFGFYLVGGTAVAIQIGHRRSVDLDWFTTREMAEPMRLASDLRQSHGTAQGVRLSFLEYRYPNLVPSVEWPEYRVRLAGLEDLACMKLSAIGGRGSKKDFIDIYALGRERFGLRQMLEFYQRKYEMPDLGHTIFALSYFDDAEEEDTPEMLWQVQWDEVKHTIEGWVRDYVRDQQPPGPGGFTP